jgi:hypothetical protein
VPVALSALPPGCPFALRCPQRETGARPRIPGSWIAMAPVPQLTVWRNRLRASQRPERIFEAVQAVIAQTGC